jgi:hypothetical protein
MLINEEWYQSKKKDLINNNFDSIILDFDISKVDTLIKKILEYYISYNYQINNNNNQYKECKYFIIFNDNFNQTIEEYIQNLVFLKYYKDETEIKLKIKKK